MSRHAGSPGSRRAMFGAAIAVMALVAACGTADLAPSASPAGPDGAASPAAPASPAAVASAAIDPRFADFHPCEAQDFFKPKTWLCTTMEVPVDHANPAAGTMPIWVYALPRTDPTTPAGPPLFTTPGGPGGPGNANWGLYGLQDTMLANHDFITIDPRGTGRSGALDCPELQSGSASAAEAREDVAICGSQLGADGDRYGAADRAMDVEVVREALGYDRIAYYGPSYGSADAQAYAARYPDRVHALILDAGFTVADDAMSYWLGQDAPRELIAIAALTCQRDQTCAGRVTDAQGALETLIARIRSAPITGPAFGDAATDPPRVVDEAAILELLVGDESRLPLVFAAGAAQAGEDQPIIDLATAHPPYWPDGDGLPSEFSSGANAAGYCNDARFVWDPADPLPERAAAYQAWLEGVGDRFAPFSAAGWAVGWVLDYCLEWPAPDHAEPVIPPGSDLSAIPTLILSGDVDANVTPSITRALLGTFPDAAFVTVAGAGHPTMSRPDACVATIVDTFVETLQVGDTSCAGPQ